MLSTWIEESELSRLNGTLDRRLIPSAVEGSPDSARATASLDITPELRDLLATADHWSRRTNGAFDPHIKSLIEVWKMREEGALPGRDAIAAAMQSRKWEEGAFGKGYALDRMLAKLDAPEAMIDFGGQVIVRGELRVTIADPARREHPVLALTLRDASLSTSSGSEKTFEIKGRRFSHIIDPRTGEALPPRGSVSVLANDALSADILSTALYVMGEDEGLRWADANGVAAIFINPHHTIRLSARARERARELELLDRDFSIKE